MNNTDIVFRTGLSKIKIPPAIYQFLIFFPFYAGTYKLRSLGQNPAGVTIAPG